MEVNRTIAIKLKPAGEKAVLQGHPWVFESSIHKQSHAGPAGNLVAVFHRRKNTFIALGLFDPNSEIRVKIVSWSAGTQLDDAWFAEKILKANEARQPLSANCNAYRVAYGENDGLPGLIVDKYDNVLVLKLYSLIWQPYLEMIIQALITVVDPKAIVLRLSRNIERLNTLENGKVIFGNLEDPVISIVEYGVRFNVHVIKGHKTGFFLDHRMNRYWVQQNAEGKRVLDVFAYAGGFSAHAAYGNARSVTSIDISKPALQLAKENVLHNNQNAKHSCIAQDAFLALTDLALKKQEFDLVIIDPPAFAKTRSEIEKAIQQYKKLATLGQALVAEKGILLLASCSSRVTREVFFSAMNIVMDPNEWKCIKQTSHDIDHPEGIFELSYLKTTYYQKSKISIAKEPVST